MCNSDILANIIKMNDNFLIPFEYVKEWFKEKNPVVEYHHFLQKRLIYTITVLLTSQIYGAIRGTM